MSQCNKWKGSIVKTKTRCFLLMFTAIVLLTHMIHARELSTEDFTFDGSFGSAGAKIEKIGVNHFKVVLGHAPEHPDWCNMLQFQILRNAKGNRLRLDVCFYGGDAYRFNHYAHSSWSYDGINWQPIKWQKENKESSKGDTLLFLEFEEDTVYFGHQVPMSCENVVEMMEKWSEHPHAKVHTLGKSLEGRNIYRLEITNPQSPYPRNRLWVHYFGNQHPGEHNAQWRMVGMIEWLLSDAGTDCRDRSISHFVLMMYPDGPSHGWYRVGVQGVDGNRSYLVTGADKQKQAHEAYITQKDLEKLMASEAPVTDLWSMHTWGGIVEPIMLPGPEMGNALPSWTKLRDIIKQNDLDRLVKPLAIEEEPGNTSHWNSGPHVQFGMTTVLCEGAGNIVTKKDNVASGAVLMKSLAQYYRGTKEVVETTASDTSAAAASTAQPPKSLHEAAKAGRLADVKSFILQGADVNAKDKNGLTALHHAAGSGHKEVAQMLIASGADVNVKGGTFGATPIENAATSLHREVVDILLEAGADINAKEDRELTALHALALYGRQDGINMMEFLLARGADIEAKSMWGTLPFSPASQISSLLIGKKYAGQ